jgi:hypothetical protein
MVLSDLIPTSCAGASQCLGRNGIDFCGITSRQTMGIGTRKRLGSFGGLHNFHGKGIRRDMREIYPERGA